MCYWNMHNDYRISIWTRYINDISVGLYDTRLGVAVRIRFRFLAIFVLEIQNLKNYDLLKKTIKDIYNGRANSITPEYPSGIYAYYLPLDSSLAPTVPFIIGPSYYGTPQTSLLKSIPSTATVYYSYTNTSTSGSSNTKKELNSFVVSIILCFIL